MLKITVQETELVFEHSLVSLSKWEALHQKPFFAWDEKDTKTQEEMLSYFEQMLINQEDLNLIGYLSPQQHVEIVEYINSNRTATVVREPPSKAGQSRENVTSELIYYWMLSFNIPFEAETWHLSRLMTLIRVCGVKNTKPQKEPAGATAAKFRELNEARRKKFGTKG